jgi:hypothetical protein
LILRKGLFKQRVRRVVSFHCTDSRLTVERQGPC